MKAKDIAKLSVKDLEAKLIELKESYGKEYVKTKVGAKAEKAVSLRNIKKDIARVQTLISLKNKESK